MLPEDEVASIHRSVKELREYFVDQIEYRRQNPGDDLISALVRAQEGDETLSDLEVLSLVVLIQFGGAETPSHLISTTLYELFENRDALEAVRADPSRAEQAVDETLRHMSTVHFVFQTATKDVEVQGQTIPSDAMVFSFIGSANRDQRAFDDPDRFDIDRKSANPHLGFAAGPHYCIGAALGRTMCGMAINSALKRMPKLHRVNPDTEWLPSFWVRGLKQFPVAP